MQRRAFTTLAAGASLGLPRRAMAQRRPVIGYLGLTTAAQYGGRLNAFREGLASSGYQEGTNVAISYRWAEGDAKRLPSLASELVREQVNVIVTPGSVTAAIAAKAASASIPIVFEIGADPVAYGLVDSMSRPGGNVTGITSLNVELGAKRLELLHELVPRLSNVAVLVNQTNPQIEAILAHIRVAATTRRLHLQVMRVGSAADIDARFDAIGRAGADGLVISADQLFVGTVQQLASLALRGRLPAIHFTREFPQARGLMSFGGKFAETHRLAGVYAGRVLRGEKPADLPVQQVARFESSINLTTARLLGINVPPAMFARVDEIIE